MLFFSPACVPIGTGACCTWLVWNHNPQRPGVGESFLRRGKNFFLQDAIISSGASCEGKKKIFFSFKNFSLNRTFFVKEVFVVADEKLSLRHAANRSLE